MSDNFFKLYHYAVDDLKLKGNDLIIYTVIVSFTESTGVYTGGNAYLMKRFGLGENTIIRAIKKLEERGLIEKEVTSYNKNFFTCRALNVDKYKYSNEKDRKDYTSKTEDYTSKTEDNKNNNNNNNKYITYRGKYVKAPKNNDDLIEV